MTNTAKHRDRTISEMRDLMPSRPIQFWEANRLAELQANRVRSQLASDGAHFDTDRLADLPRIRTIRRANLAVSGATHWQGGAWHIEINSDEPLVRQRFTLAHEFKHVLDAPLLTRTYRSILEEQHGQRRTETICDYFAACLLMPKRWVKRLWYEGNRDIRALANAFDVSTTAMKRRIDDLGLTEQVATDSRWTARRRFYRTSAPLRDPVTIEPTLRYQPEADAA